MGRQLFIQKVMDWRHEKGDKIFQQLRKMGASLDWSQTQFTMSKVRFFLLLQNTKSILGLPFQEMISGNLTILPF